jgi:hypothetical protein
VEASEKALNLYDNTQQKPEHRGFLPLSGTTPIFNTLEKPLLNRFLRLQDKKM